MLRFALAISFSLYRVVSVSSLGSLAESWKSVGRVFVSTFTLGRNRICLFQSNLFTNSVFEFGIYTQNLVTSTLESQRGLYGCR